MSRWWPDRIVLSLAPGAAKLTRHARWPRRPAPEHHHVGIEPSGELHNWQAALAAAGERLRALAWRGALLQVELSNHLVRYAVLPWVEGLRGEDALAYARERLTAIYGASALEWAISLDAAPHGAPRLIAAVHGELLTALRAEAARCGLRLAAARPVLAAELARCERMIDVPSGWFVQAGQGRLCLARFRDGAWQGVRNVRCDADASELPALLEQDALAAGLDRGAAVVFLQGMRAAAQPLRDRGWNVRGVDGGAA